MMAILLALLAIIMILGFPIAVALGLSTLLVLAPSGVPFTILPLLMFNSMENFIFLAMPLFMIAGEVMNRAGIAEDLIEFAAAVVGSIRGGLAMVNVGTAMVFAEISGSAVADVAALGSILIPQMEKRGYPRAFAAALTSSAASLAIIIPPSLPFILYGALAGVSVAKVFIAGIVPGLILGFTLMAFAYGFALRYGWPSEGPFQLKRLILATRRAVWALSLPVIILGGILGGVFTPTEAAAVALVAAMFIGLVITRKITLAGLPELVLVAFKRTSVVMLMVATSYAFGWYLSNEGIPQRLSGLVLGVSDSPHVVLFIINAVLILLGVFLHGVAIMVLTVPILLPLVTQLGVDPVHFGVIIGLNVALGQQTPPVASVLLTACAVSGCKVAEVMRYNWWFILALFIVLQVVTYVPWLSLALPRALA